MPGRTTRCQLAVRGGCFLALVYFLGVSFVHGDDPSDYEPQTRFAQALAKKQVVTPVAEAVQASFRLVWSNGQLPENIEDLRLNELEDAAGITRYVWEMAIPAGQRLILHFSGKVAANPQASMSDCTWSMNGPLAPCFTNRISLVRRMTNNNQTAQFFVQINTQCLGGLGTRGNNFAFSPFEIGPGWEGDWGATFSPVPFPATAWKCTSARKTSRTKSIASWTSRWPRPTRMPPRARSFRSKNRPPAGMVVAKHKKRSPKTRSGLATENPFRNVWHGFLRSQPPFQPA
jgi:hypothetical protein